MIHLKAIGLMDLEQLLINMRGTMSLYLVILREYDLIAYISKSKNQQRNKGLEISKWKWISKLCGRSCHSFYFLSRKGEIGEFSMIEGEGKNLHNAVYKRVSDSVLSSRSWTALVEISNTSNENRIRLSSVLVTARSEAFDVCTFHKRTASRVQLPVTAGRLGISYLIPSR